MKLAVLLLFSASLWAQSAPVVVLDREDADKARELWDAKIKAEQAWNLFRSNLGKDYLTVPSGDPKASYREFVAPLTSGSTATGTSGILVLGYSKTTDGGTWKATKDTKTGSASSERLPQKDLRYFRKGWEDGLCSSCVPLFQLSEDFRYLVPAKPEPEPVNNCPTFKMWQ